MHRLAIEKADTDGFWLRDFETWLLARIRERCWWKQADIASLVEQHRKTAVCASFGVGKSFTAGRLGARWLASYPPGEAFLVTTAPTHRQVRAITWREINKAHSRGNLPGRCNQTEWVIGKELVGIGMSPDRNEQDVFQGIHARRVLVIIDEAAGVSESRFDDAEKLLTNDDCRLLAIGNSDHAGSYWHRIMTGAEPGWETMTITAYDSPNLEDSDRARAWVAANPDAAAELVGQIWVDEMAEKYGRDSPQFRQRVLAEFPQDITDGIIPRSAVLRCQAQDPPSRNRQTDVVALGVDVGGGKDRTVVAEFVNDERGGRLWSIQEADPERAAAAVLEKMVEWGLRNVSHVNVDAIGVGWAFCGLLRQAFTDTRFEKVPVNPIKVSEAASEPARFVNVRAEMHWRARERIVAGAWNLSDLANDTVDQLTAVRYLTRGDRVQVESKDELKRPHRLGQSPDEADAFLLATWHPPTAPSERVANAEAIEAAVAAFDPEAFMAGRQ